MEIMYSHKYPALICNDKAEIMYSGLNEAYRDNFKFFKVPSTVNRIDFTLQDPGMVCTNSCPKINIIKLRILKRNDDLHLTNQVTY